MGWLMPRRSRSLAGSQGRRFPRRGGGPSRVPARAVLLLLAMVAALAPRAFAQMTPNPGDRWTPGGIWNHDVTTTSLEGRLMLQQSVTIDRLGGTQTWANAAIDACPWTKVTPPLPSTSCTTFKGYETSSSSFRNHPLTVANFVATQAMIDNGGVVIRLRWKNYNSPAGGNVAMTEWVPLLPPPNAALVLTPASISENAGVSTVTATLNRTTSAATTITVSAAEVAPAVAGDFALSSATTLTIAAGSTTSSGAVTITANDNSVASGSKQVTVSATATGGNGVAAPSSATLTITDDEYGLNVGSVTGQATEAGGTATFTVALITQPSQAVTVSVTSLDASEGTVSPSSLTFETSDWSTTQAVTVTGADDAIDDGTVTWAVRLDPSSGDANYNGLANVDVSVTTTDDDDAPGVTLAVSPSSISENGGVSTVTATLSRASVAATTVTVTPVTGFYTVGSDAEIVIAAGSTANATDTATVAAVNDAIDNASDRTGTVTATITNARATADGTTMAVSGGALTLTDDDEKGLALVDSSLVPLDHLAVTAGSSASYTVALTSEPTGAVTVSIASDNADVTANPASLTFTMSNWNSPQTVSVSASSDGDDYADAATLTHDAAGGGYGDDESASLPVAVAETGGTRVLAVPVTAVTERVYSIGAATVRVTYSPLAGAAVPSPAGSGFGLGEGDARVAVDVSAVSGLPSGGLTLCLAGSQGIRDAAAGRKLVLLRHDGTAWTAVSGSAWDATEMRACASGVTSPSPFALGYADRSVEFAWTVSNRVYTVDEAIADLVLPPVKEGAGDAPVTCCTHDLTPERLPAGLRFDEATWTLSGTPKEVFPATTYAWTARDADGPASLTFTIAVEHGLEKARARLKAINESVLPELSRALWGSALDAVTGRLASPDAAAPTAAGGLEAAAGFVRAHEGALEEGDVSWKELLGAESFAFGLAGEDGPGGPGAGGVVAWGSGDWRKLSRDEDALDWSGDAFSAHVGVDAALRPDLRGGLAASWFSSDVAYTDRSGDAAVKGSHESRMTALTPYVGWAAGGGTRLWGAAGYGWGEIEIVDGDLRDRFGAQTADSRFLAGAAGGSVPVWSGASMTLEAKGSAEATRWRVADNGDAIAAVSVDTRRLRLAAEGSRAYALAGGASLTPTLEAGVRWDGGDGATGTGLEAGGGLSWTDPARGLTVEAKGRALLVHDSDVEEWGASGSMRLDPDADGLGLSFRLLPSWGASGSGVARLWDEGVAATRPADGGGDGARLETDLGYGLPALGGHGTATPYAGFGLAQGGERAMRAGVRLDLGTGFDLGVEAERRENATDAGHRVGLDLRIGW